MVTSHQNDLDARDTAACRLDRIVVGVDFTEASLAVAKWVGRCFSQTAEVTLLHVAPVWLTANVPGDRSNRLTGPGSRPGERMRSLRGALRGLASTMGRTCTVVQVRVGDPATELATYADLVGADLVVVGGNARYHVAPRYETATTERLLRRMSRPVLVVRNVQTPPTAVLAAVADDANAMSVLRAAWRVVARPCKARVVGLRVVDQRSEGSTEWLECSLRTAGIPPDASDVMVVEGEPLRKILDVARRLRTDIIAVGTDARVGEVRPCEDSDDVAHRLVRTATCSVLVVPHLVGIPAIGKGFGPAASMTVGARDP